MAVRSIDDLVSGGLGQMAPGDVFAFRGVSEVDRFIQEASLSGICHVGVVIKPAPGAPLALLEATGAGITATPVEAALRKYAGPDDHHICFYLPLAPNARAQVDVAALARYATDNAGQHYNYSGVIGAGLYDLENPFARDLIAHLDAKNPLAAFIDRYETFRETFWSKVFELNPKYRRLFCSQLVTEALQTCGVVFPGPGGWPNPRLVVPVSVCNFPIYATWFQLNDPAIDEPFKQAPGAAR
jgi:hypothetical protein